MIGEAHPRLGGDRFVAGTGRFVEDVRVTGLLHAAVLRSPHAHARLVSIDAKRARDLPGVHAVLTAADVPAAAIIPNRVPAPKGTDRYLQPAIARDVVRFVGEPVALVVADDPYIARDALDRIDVVYQPLAAYASTGEALGAGAARLFPGTDSNNVATNTMRVGDADAAPTGAQLTPRERFTSPRQTAAALVPAEFGAALLPGPYRVPNYGCDLWSVVTNKTPAGTLRSPGRPECNFVRERLLDQAAARLGIDPAEIRRRNLIRADEMPYDCGTKSFGVSTVYDSGDFPALFDELLRRLDYAGTRAEQAAMNARPSGPRRGIGLAIYVEKTGLGPFETTQVEARPDGRFIVDTGASSMGPGLETVLAQILGDAVGLPASRFDVRHADTAAVESGVGTYGSRGTVTAGNAAHLAAAKLIAEARQRAAEAWGVPESEVTYASGVVEARGRRLTLADLARERRLAAGASFEVPKVTYAGCAAAVVADVDPETGVVTLRRVVVGADVGRAVNPALVDGQLIGGVAFGIGNTMHESLAYDAQGQLLSSTLMDYALPAAADIPPVDGFYQEVRATTNPLGLRGLGECGNPGLGAATANAVCDALSPRDASITALPLTPARVFSSARARRDSSRR